jgi:hypothetical protein
MKRLPQIFLVIMILMAIMAPVAMAEPVPVEGVAPDLSQLLTKEVLATMAGMVLVTSILTQGIKVVFLRNAGIETIRTVAFIVSLVVVVLSKLVLQAPLSMADILIIPGNAVLVWLSAMKAYEQTLGTASTPAGNTNGPIH